jgi:putative intracellular protease/amidase
MPQLGFESTIPVFEREKIVHASDRGATVTDNYTNTMNARYRDNEFDARLVPGGDVAEHLIDLMGTVKAM